MNLLNNKDWLYDQYITQRKSTTEISSLVGVTRQTVSNKLKKFGIKVRKSSECIFSNEVYVYLNDRDWLYDQYITQRKSTVVIALMLGVTHQTINFYIKKYNIEIRESYIHEESLCLLNNKDWLREQYIINNKSAKYIAKLLNISITSVLRKLKLFNIEIRKGGYHILDERLDKDWLYNKYIIEGMTIHEISNITGINHATILFRLKKYNIEVRKGGNLISEEALNYLSDKDWLYNKYIIEEKSAPSIAKEIGVSEGCVSKYLKKYNIEIRKLSNEQIHFIDNFKYYYDEHHIKEKLPLDKISVDYGFNRTYCSELAKKLGLKNMSSTFKVTTPQQKIIDIVKKSELDIVINDREILEGKEIDIFIPKCNLGIEINGVYWHSEEMGKDRNYHRNKHIKCKSKDVDLIQLWDVEICNKFPIVESIISNRLNMNSDKIGARKCSIHKIESAEARLFFENNHIQGSTNSTINYGLVYENKLVSLMSFKKVCEKWELVRFCNKMHITVIGAATRLFIYFIKNWNPDTVASFSDNRLFNGDIYKTLGFEFSHETKPTYWYHRPDLTEIVHKRNFQKKKMVKKIDNYDMNKTEFENMKNLGYYWVWDCGKKCWNWRNVK